MLFTDYDLLFIHEYYCKALADSGTHNNRLRPFNSKHFSFPFRLFWEWRGLLLRAGNDRPIKIQYCIKKSLQGLLWLNYSKLVSMGSLIFRTGYVIKFAI